MRTMGMPYVNAFMASSRAPFSSHKVYRYAIFFWISRNECRTDIEQDEQIKAGMENGLLTVTFPKSLPELLPKKIVISNL